MIVVAVPVTPGGVALPQFDQRLRHRPAVFVQPPPADDDALAQRRAGVLPGQIRVVRPDLVIAEYRTGHLR